MILYSMLMSEPPKVILATASSSHERAILVMKNIFPLVTVRLQLPTTAKLAPVVTFPLRDTPPAGLTLTVP